jgi:hypothetical protein
VTFVWAGVDVGASKGFDVAVVDRERLVGPPRRIVAVAGVVDYLSELRPAVIAVDSPRRPALPGRRSRAASAIWSRRAYAESATRPTRRPFAATRRITVGSSTGCSSTKL